MPFQAQHEQGNITVDKQRHRFIILGGLGLCVLGTGACQKPVAEDATPPAPISQRPGRKLGAGGQAGAPGSPTNTTPAGAPGAQARRRPPGARPNGGMGGQARAGRPGAQAKGGAKQVAGGMPTTARPARDPFAAGGAAPGAPGRPGAGASVAQPPRRIVYGGRRTDPFYVSWTLPVPPPYVFNEVEPIRLASDYVPTPPAQPYEVREQPEMRVSGIMTGDGVFAILESGGDKVDVVKPGSSVDISVGQTKRTYKVVSITKDKVRLRSQVGNVIYTQEVPLSDVAVGVAARAPGGFAPGGAGGSSGGMVPGGTGGGFAPGGSAGPRGGRPGGGGGSAGPRGGGARLGGGGV
jgi:hypothetical protein